jgi:hypothetical protein
MASVAGTILDRAVSSWEGSSVAFLYPVLTHPQPAQYELARRIAEEYPGRFDDQLVALWSSPDPVVVAQALTTLGWMKSPALAELPRELLADTRKVTIAGCLVVTRELGEIARECAREARGRAEPCAAAAPAAGGGSGVDVGERPGR